MRIYLAPMEGLLDSLLRDILTRPGGVDVCVTEFVRVSNSLLPPRIFQRVAPELLAGSKTANQVPVRVQLLGSDPGLMASNAARLAALKPAAIDLNFGCPAKTVNRHQGGAVLLREPERLLQIVSAVRQALPSAMPLTAKMRLGYEDKSLAVDCAQAIATGGARELVVHARTKTEGYKPPAHWEWVGRIQAAVHIPVIANGEIWTLADYRRCVEVGGVEDVMLGRGLLANPALALVIKHGEAAAWPWESVMPLLHDYWQMVVRHNALATQCGRVKQWLNYLRLHFPEAEAAFQGLRRVTNPVELETKLFTRQAKICA